MRNVWLRRSCCALALTACQQDNDDNIAIDESNSANAEIETLPPDETVTNGRGMS